MKENIKKRLVYILLILEIIWSCFIDVCKVFALGIGVGFVVFVAFNTTLYLKVLFITLFIINVIIQIYEFRNKTKD